MAARPVHPFLALGLSAMLALKEFIEFICDLAGRACQFEVFTFQYAEPLSLRICHQHINIARKISNLLDSPRHDQLRMAFESLCYNVVEPFSLMMKYTPHNLFHTPGVGLK